MWPPYACTERVHSLYAFIIFEISFCFIVLQMWLNRASACRKLSFSEFLPVQVQLAKSCDVSSRLCVSVQLVKYWEAFLPEAKAIAWVGGAAHLLPFFFFVFSFLLLFFFFFGLPPFKPTKGTLLRQREFTINSLLAFRLTLFRTVSSAVT